MRFGNGGNCVRQRKFCEYEKCLKKGLASDCVFAPGRAIDCNMYVEAEEQSNRGDQDNREFKPLKTKRRLLYLKTQSVPRRKHFSSRL